MAGSYRVGYLVWLFKVHPLLVWTPWNQRLSGISKKTRTSRYLSTKRLQGVDGALWHGDGLLLAW